MAWGESDGNGASRLLLAYALFLIHPYMDRQHYLPHEQLLRLDAVLGSGHFGSSFRWNILLIVAYGHGMTSSSGFMLTGSVLLTADNLQ